MTYYADDLEMHQMDHRVNTLTFEYNLKYKYYMRLGRVFPITKSQAVYFIEKNFTIDSINSKDVEMIEKFINSWGFVGLYKLTNDRHFVTLDNQNVFIMALKKEFKI